MGNMETGWYITDEGERAAIDLISRYLPPAEECEVPYDYIRAADRFLENRKRWYHRLFVYSVEERIIVKLFRHTMEQRFCE
jgi:hypothetical protein